MAKCLTFKDSLEVRLQALDAAYQKLRLIHKDMDHVNNESAEYHRSVEKFDAACAAIWRLKAAWSDEL